MQLSSKFCDLQAQAQLDRAANNPLPNVRVLAEKAALAWQQESALALKRERRHLAAGEGQTLSDDGAPAEDMSGPDPDEYVPRAPANAGAGLHDQA